MSRLRALAVSLAALVLAVVAVWAPASADGDSPQSADATGTPLNVTAHVTRDSITVSFRSTDESTEWRVSLTAQPRTAESQWGWPSIWPSIASKKVANALSYTVDFNGLLPGHGHTVRVRSTEVYPPPGVAFDVRTEGVAAAAELAARRPTIVATQVDNGVLHVDWLPPTAAPDTPHVVSVREYGTGGDGLEQFTDAGVRSASFADINPGTTYRVLVEPKDGYSQHDEQIIETPSDLPQDRAWRSWFRPRLRVDWDPWTSGAYGYGTFQITWDGIESVEFAQVEWELDGYVMSSIGDAPIVINVDQPGRYTFRARFYLRYKVWSNWTGLVQATTTPSRPYKIRVDERIDGLRVEWDPWPRPAFTPVDGYRIRYERYGEPDQVFVVREGTSVTIPVESKCEPHRITVAAFSDEFGEGPAGQFGRVTNACLPMSVDIDVLDATCNNDRNAPSVVLWTISGGVGPYVISVRGRKPIATDERTGLLRLFCEVQPTDGAHHIPVVVTDGLGRRATATMELPAPPTEEWRREERPFSAEIVELRSISVHRDEVRLSWRCPPWEPYGIREAFPPPTFLLRWRSAASPEWTYINGTATPMVRKMINGCHWTWAGLAPGTRYEYQLAAWLRPEELDEPERLRWSPLHTVTTLGEAQDVRVNRAPDGVAVVWRAQPHAWAYQVILRNGEESWWKYYEPSGGDIERAVFAGLSPNAHYDVDIISPPQVEGREVTPHGFIKLPSG